MSRVLHNHRDVKKVWGFTLIEVLVVIAIMFALIGFSATSLAAFQRHSILTGEVENVVTILEEARKNTLSSLDDTQYGVHFENDKVVLYKGATYTPAAPENVTSTVNTRNEITNISLNGGVDDILFDRITGETVQSGSVRIQLRRHTDQFRIVHVHQSGLIEVE